MLNKLNPGWLRPTKEWTGANLDVTSTMDCRQRTQRIYALYSVLSPNSLGGCKYSIYDKLSYFKFCKCNPVDSKFYNMTKSQNHWASINDNDKEMLREHRRRLKFITRAIGSFSQNITDIIDLLKQRIKLFWGSNYR